MDTPQYHFDAPDMITGDPLIYLLKGHGFQAIVTSSTFQHMEEDEDVFYMLVDCEKPRLLIQIAFDKNCKNTWTSREHFVKWNHQNGCYGNLQVDGTKKNIRLAAKLTKIIKDLTKTIPVEACPNCGGRGLVGTDEEIKEGLKCPVDMDALNRRICPACHLSACVAKNAPQTIKVKVRW